MTLGAIAACALAWIVTAGAVVLLMRAGKKMGS